MRDREQAPFAWDTFESVDAAVHKVDPRSCHEFLDGAGHKNLARFRQRFYAGGDVDCETLERLSDEFAFAAVHTCPDFHANTKNAIDNGPRAFNCQGGRIERREEPVAGRANLAPAEARQGLAHERVMSREHGTPTQ